MTEIKKSFAERLTVARQLAARVGEELAIKGMQLGSNGLSVEMAAMVEIRENGLGGFDSRTRKGLKEVARDSFSQNWRTR